MEYKKVQFSGYRKGTPSLLRFLEGFRAFQDRHSAATISAGVSRRSHSSNLLARKVSPKDTRLCPDPARTGAHFGFPTESLCASGLAIRGPSAKGPGLHPSPLCRVA